MHGDQRIIDFTLACPTKNLYTADPSVDWWVLPNNAISVDADECAHERDVTRAYIKRHARNKVRHIHNHNANSEHD